MFKKLVVGLLIVILVACAITGWLFFTSGTAFQEKSKYLYIPTEHATFEDVLQTLKDSNFINSPGSFRFLAHRMDLAKNLRPGRYEIKKGMSLFEIARMLHNGRQSPVNLVITKLRTKEDLASFIGKRFECDSTSVMDYMNNTDSLRENGFDTNTVMTTVYPNTYTYFWNSTPSTIFRKFYSEYKMVWTDERKQAAQQQGLTPTESYILASIIEEETNNNSEKGNIASVYINRYKKGMRLQADPTVKFALHDFALKRIYDKHTEVESPYNTYKVLGFPPGPICTPSLVTLDSVLHAPQTNYYYFVARTDYAGHIFSETLEEHLKYAKEYHKSEDEKKLKASKGGIAKKK